MKPRIRKIGNESVTVYDTIVKDYSVCKTVSN
jgi:hypothetical protein